MRIHAPAPTERLDDLMLSFRVVSENGRPPCNGGAMKRLYHSALRPDRSRP